VIFENSVKIVFVIKISNYQALILNLHLNNFKVEDAPFTTTTNIYHFKKKSIHFMTYLYQLQKLSKSRMY